MKKPNLLIGLERNFLNLPNQISLTSLIAYKVGLSDYDYIYMIKKKKKKILINIIDSILH
jgi:hypothetical protein